MGTTKPRCVKFHHSLRCIDNLVLKKNKQKKQIPLSNGCTYPMLWGYRMKCSWIKRKKLAPNLKIWPSKRRKLTEKNKTITYPSGSPAQWLRNAKWDCQGQAAFLTHNDFCTPCASWYAFLFREIDTIFVIYHGRCHFVPESLRCI